MPVNSGPATMKMTPDGRSEGVATWKSPKGSGVLCICLYRVNGDEAETLGAAEINTSSSPWELTLAAAPGHGRRFFQMLIALSGDSGLIPTRTGGEVTPKASAVFQKLYRSADFRKERIDGPHFESWLNAVYYFKGEHPDLDRRIKNHQNWSRTRSPLFSWFRFGTRPDVSWISDQARTLLDDASLLYTHGKDGCRAIATYAAKLLGQEYRREESPEVSALYPTESYPGVIATETPYRQTFLYRTEADARTFATHMRQNVVETTPDHIIPVIHVNLHRLVQNNQTLFDTISKRLGMVTWSFLAAYWDIVADELGVNHATAFADDSCIVLLEPSAQQTTNTQPEMQQS